MFEKACKQEHMDVMAIMREPISWLGSWYRYRQRGFLDGKPTSTRGISFDDFVQAYLSDERPPFANVGSQAKFLEPRPNGTQVSQLFRYENPSPMLGFLEDRLDRTIELEQVNVSSKSDVNLSEETEQRLRRQHQEDFDLYQSIDDAD